MIYLHYDSETGKFLGAYHESVRNIPVPNIAVDDAEWKAAMDAGQICDVIQDGKPVFIPQPPVDRTDFDNACSLFRSVCAQIGAMLGVEDFRGGFDEMTAFQQSEAFRTLEGLHIAIEWSAANELCKYEGAKIGFGQPQWWYECWKVTPEP